MFKTIFKYIHKKFRFVHTNTFYEYRKKLRASPRVHLVLYNNNNNNNNNIWFKHQYLEKDISNQKCYTSLTFKSVT